MPTFVFGEYDPELVFHNDRTMGVYCKIDAPDLIGAVKCLLDRFEGVMECDKEHHYHLYCIFPSMFDYEEDDKIEDFNRYLKECFCWGKEHLSEVLADLRDTDPCRCSGGFLAEDSIIFTMMGQFACGYKNAPTLKSE